MKLETAYTTFFFTSIICNLLSILAAWPTPTLSTSWLYTKLALVIALPLGAYTLTYISIWSKLLPHSDQRDVAQASPDSSHADDSDEPFGILPITVLTCFSTIQRYFVLWTFARIDLGYYNTSDLVYALGLVELFVVLRLGLGFRRAFQKRVVMEDAEKGLQEEDNLNECNEKY